MNYKHYFKRLTKTEDRLFQENYWKLGFVTPERKHLPITYCTLKWSKMLFVIGAKYDLKQCCITEAMLLEYMDNPRRDKEYTKYYKAMRSTESALRYKREKDNEDN